MTARAQTYMKPIVNASRWMLASGLLLKGTAAAAVFSVSLGTGAPANTLGPYSLLGLAPDTRPTGSVVWDLPDPVAVSFDRPMKLLGIGDGWSSWSHGFAGDVYATGTSELVITPAPNTYAIGLSIEPDLTGVMQFIVGVGGTTVTLAIDGDAGSQWIGFWSDDLGTPLGPLWIRDATGTAGGFAVGEIAVCTIENVPEPAVFALVFASGLVVLASVRIRSHRH